jgi:PAS domain S-box-containing protein
MQHLPGGPDDLAVENTALRQRVAALEAELATYRRQAPPGANPTAGLPGLDRRFTVVLDQLPVGVSIAAAPAGELVFHNSEAVRLLRHPLLPDADERGYAQYGALHPDGRPYLPEEYPIARALLGEASIPPEDMRYRRGDGTLTTFSVSAAPIRDADGQVVAVVSTFHDIAAQRELDTALREREQQLVSVIESVDGRLWSLDRELRLLVGSAQFHRDVRAITGQELRVGESIWALPMPPEFREFWQASYERALAGEAFGAERQSAGVTIAYRFMPIRSTDGAIAGVTVFGLDITKQVDAETAHQETESKLTALFEILPVGVSILDSERRVVYANPALSQILRINADGLAQSVYRQRQYLRADGTPMPADEFASVRGFREQQPITNVETGVLTETGEVRWTNVSAVPVDFPDWRAVVVTTDITERKRAEQAMEQATVRLRVLAEASQAFVEAKVDLGAVLDQIVRTTAGVLGDGCAVSLISDDQLWLQRFAVYDTDPARLHLLRENNEHPQPLDAPLAGPRIIQTGQPILLPVVDHERFRASVRPESQALWDQLTFHSMLGVSMRVQGRPIGVLTLFRHRPEQQPFNADDLVLAQDLGDRAALAIRNAQLFEQAKAELAERKRVQRATELLHAAGQLLARPLSLDQVLETLLDVLQQLIPYDSANIMLPDDTATFRVRYQRGYETWTDPEQVRALRFDPAERPPIATIVRTRRSVLIGDTHQESGWRPMLGTEHIGCWLGVPLIANNKLVGIFSIDRHEPNSVTTENVRLAETLAASAAVAIERAQLIAELRDERAQLARRVAERTADLSLANAELVRAAGLKDEFLANMSHELRTPLNGILGRSEALQEEIYGPVTPKQVEVFQGITESGQHLLALINDILDLSKVEAGRITLERETLDIDMLCTASMRMVAQIAMTKQISLNTSIDTAAELISADERRLKQILVNLLSNAVKFTPRGGKIGLEVRSDAERQQVTFTVWDTGVGISEADLAKLFQPFIQIDNRLNRAYTGTGLGLALVRRLAEAHGGSVGVESVAGQGSRFSVILPWDPAEQRAVRLATPSVVNTAQPAIRQAMVIEDSTTAAAQLSRYLQELGAHVEISSHSTGTVERAIALQPDVIILDILLPDEDGWQVLRALKAEPRTHDIPVIVVSVVDTPERARELGAAEVLLKPIDREMFVAALRRATTRTAEPLVERALVAVPQQAMRPRVLLAEDNETNIEMLFEYLRSKGYDVTVARNGEEAIVRAQEERPDVILMDIQMPGVDGLEAIRRIRADSVLAKTPIIAVTALALPRDRERCLQAGADEYMAKPVSLRMLMQTIEHHRQRRAEAT